MDISHESKEIISGSVAGAVGKLFEYPFDTIKVRLQAQSLYNPQYEGAFHCLVQTLRNEGFGSMYKGISMPILAASVENAVLFSSFNFFERTLEPGVPRPAERAVLSGSLSGLVASFALTPIELVKCQVQVDSASKHANIFRLILNTWRADGIAGFWRGQTGTALRECGGSAAWFGSYCALKQDFGSVLAGAAAGISYNISLYPADSIKSRMQTDRLNGHASGLSFIQTGRLILKQSGVRGLYRGSLVTCLRAGPSNAIIFTVHDRATELLK